MSRQNKHQILYKRTQQMLRKKHQTQYNRKYSEQMTRNKLGSVQGVPVRALSVN